MYRVAAGGDCLDGRRIKRLWGLFGAAVMFANKVSGDAEEICFGVMIVLMGFVVACVNLDEDVLYKVFGLVAGMDAGSDVAFYGRVISCLQKT